MRFRTLLAILGILVVPFVTPARTAKELNDACKDESSYVLKTACLAYIEGYYDGLGVLPATFPEHDMPLTVPKFIATGKYTLQQLKDAFLTYLAAHPKDENARAGDTLFFAWMDQKMISMAKRSEP